jgi:hypothetical protein
MLGVETSVIPSAAVNFQDAGRGDGAFFDPFGYGFYSPYYLFDGGFEYGYGRRGYRGEYWDGRAGFHGKKSFRGERADVSHGGGAVFQGGGGFHGGGAGGGFPRWWWRGRPSLRSRTEHVRRRMIRSPPPHYLLQKFWDPAHMAELSPTRTSAFSQLYIRIERSDDLC